MMTKATTIAKKLPVRRTALVCLGLCLGLGLAIAPAPAAPLPAAVPVPTPRPEIDVQGRIVVAPDLKTGLEYIEKGNIAGARAISDELSGDLLGRHILQWAMALSGRPAVSAAEIRDTRDKLRNWPGMERLRANYELALYREAPPARDVLAAFADRKPETVRGEILLIRALIEVGQREAAQRRAREIWRGKRLDDHETVVFSGEFGSLLGKADHLRRMQVLLYQDRISPALAAARKAGAESLYQAWVQVIRTPAGAGAALGAIDDAFKHDPAVLYLKIRQLRELDKNEEAAQLLRSMPTDREKLVDPGEWWVEQRIVSRGLFEKGDAKTAYEIAAAHRASDPDDVAEAEFHAGWYALRGLERSDLATEHFKKLLAAADNPGDKARAWYWLARASEKEDGSNTADSYARAAAYPATYYGQLASAALGQDAISFAAPEPKEADRTRFVGREAVAAIRRLEDAGSDWRAGMLYRALAAEMESPGEIALLVEMADRRADHRLALQIGKIAYGRGLEVAALAFPLGALPDTADTAGSGLALAYSVARQESAFDLAAVSPANARGLLQLLPGTARGVAARHGLAYAPARLTTDATYNVTLGSHYLGEQIAAFGESYILTFVAYNAGPRRVSQWIERFGDPRGKSLEEVVDWVEKIPFTETRDYVQRVIENYEIYKTRLGQTADIENDLRFGRR